MIRDYRLAGDSQFNNYQFHDALTSYQKALAEVDKNTNPRTWASLMIVVSNTYGNLGIRKEGDSAHDYLRKAVDSYNAILKIYTQKDSPEDWAMTHNNLGTALQEQGIRTGGEAGRELLSQAVAAE